MIIEGETGMGKSALTSVLFNEIKDKKLDSNGCTHYAAFIEAYGEINDYNLRLFLLQIFSSLESHQILLSIVANVVRLIAKEIINDKSDHPEKLYQKIADDESLETVLSILNDRNKAENFIENLFFEIQYIYYQLSSKWENFNGSFLRTLIYSQASTRERMSAINALKVGSKFHDFQITTEGIAKETLHSFMGLLVALNQKTSFTIFIDQLEELFKVKQSKQMSNQFFTLLLTLRQLGNFILILSGNLEAYKNLLSGLDGDFTTQIEDWHEYVYLPHLNESQVSEIVSNMLFLLWNKQNLPINKLAFYYPFSEKTIQYLYLYNDRNLRRTLVRLHDIISRCKIDGKIPDLTDPIASIGKLKLIQDPLIIPKRIRTDFVNYLMSSNLQDKTRAEIPEKGLKVLFEVLDEKLDYITNVSLSGKSMKNTGKKPDIYFKHCGPGFQQHERRIGIEVKTFRMRESVPRKDIEKTTIFLERDDLDYVIWITNRPLDQRTMNNLDANIKSKLINTSPRTQDQFAYIYWSYEFKNAMGRRPTLDEAKQLLTKIGIQECFFSDRNSLLQYEKLNGIKFTSAPYKMQKGVTGYFPKRSHDPQDIQPKSSKQKVLQEQPSPNLVPNEKSKFSEIDKLDEFMDKIKTFLTTEFESFLKSAGVRKRKLTYYNKAAKKLKFSIKDVSEKDFYTILQEICDTFDGLKTTVQMVAKK